MTSRSKMLIAAMALAGLFIGTSLQAEPAPGRLPTEDIRDIHGPVAMPGPRPVWLYFAAVGGLAVAVGAVALYRRRPPALTPAARALLALDQLRPFTGADARAFSFTVSEIVRRYVEESFPVRAAHRTTEELLAELMREAGPVAAKRWELGEFLRYCDLAKFAGWSLSADDMAAMLASAEAFVRGTQAAGTAGVAAPAVAAPAPPHPVGPGASA